MTGRPHATAALLFDGLASRIEQADIPTLVDAQGKTADASRDASETELLNRAKMTDHWRGVAEVSMTQAEADDELARAPRPAAVRTAQKNAADATRLKLPTAHELTQVANQLTAQREQALDVHAAASQATVQGHEAASNFDLMDTYSDRLGGSGGSGSSAGSDGSGGFGNGDGSGGSSAGSDGGSGGSAFGGGGADDPSSAGTHTSSDMEGGGGDRSTLSGSPQQPSMQPMSGIGQGQGAGQGAGAGGAGSPFSTGAGGMLGAPGARLPKNNKDNKDGVNPTAAAGAAGFGAGLGAAGLAAGSDVGQSVRGVNTAAHIRGIGITSPTPISANGANPNAQAGGRGPLGGGAGGVGAPGAGGAGGGKSRKPEKLIPSNPDVKLVGGDVAVGQVEGGVFGRAQAEHRTASDYAGGTRMFHEEEQDYIAEEAEGKWIDNEIDRSGWSKVELSDQHEDDDEGRRHNHG